MEIKQEILPICQIGSSTLDPALWAMFALLVVHLGLPLEGICRSGVSVHEGGAWASLPQQPLRTQSRSFHTQSHSFSNNLVRSM